MAKNAMQDFVAFFGKRALLTAGGNAKIIVPVAGPECSVEQPYKDEVRENLPRSRCSGGDLPVIGSAASLLCHRIIHPAAPNEQPGTTAGIRFGQGLD
ncbi:hypothetical protein [Flavisolibacter nicotianae]|uniref:hypothetical protein n=1 Tax=Flavisolibacter nicotianae TaxID=2364882 RepID=UPI0013C40527|nr:hypothetical protein [Flavisolibacter nicotianae]